MIDDVEGMIVSVRYTGLLDPDGRQVWEVQYLTSDPVQVAEALAAVVSMGEYDGVHPNLKLASDVARFWWCKTHGVLVRWDDATNCPAGAYKPETCRMVLRRMIDIPEGET